jgi:hypothetical protein
MGTTSTSFKPGNEFGSAGRPPGARNKSSYDLRERLKTRGDKDPAEFLSEIVSNEDEPKELRIAAADKLMPYYYSKLGAIPVPADPVFIEQAVSFPRPETIAQATNNLNVLFDMKTTGQLDFATADSLIADQRVILNAMVDVVKALAQTGDPDRPQIISIVGGLPQLPGTSVVMPDLSNGNVAGEPLHMNGYGPQPPEQDP